MSGSNTSPRCSMQPPKRTSNMDDREGSRVLKSWEPMSETQLPTRIKVPYMTSGASHGEGNGTHSSTLAWKIPRTEDPSRLQSMGSLRVGHDRATSLSPFIFMHWRRKWQPTPVFLPGESQGWRSLAGCRLWGRTESDTTEAT